MILWKLCTINYSSINLFIILTVMLSESRQQSMTYLTNGFIILCLVQPIRSHQHSIAHYSDRLIRQLLWNGGTTRDIFVVANRGFDDHLIYAVMAELSRSRPGFVVYTVSDYETFKDRVFVRRFDFHQPVMVMFMDASLREMKYTKSLYDADIFEKVVYVVVIVNSFEELSSNFVLSQIQKSFLSDLFVIVVFRAQHVVQSLHYERGKDALKTLDLRIDGFTLRRNSQ